MHRAGSLISTELSVLQHRGNYDAGDNGLGSIDSHFDNLLGSLQTVRQKSLIKYSSPTIPITAHPNFSLSWTNIADTPIPSLNVSGLYAQTIESGATIRRIDTGKDYRSPGRQFSLYRETVFSLDPELPSLLNETTDHEAVGLGDESTELLLSLIDDRDSTVAPAYTTFSVDQQWLPPYTGNV